jgi:hypothetical protein
MKLIRPKMIVCSGTTMGGQPAMRTYCLAMVRQFDETQITRNAVDQGHHNYLIHTDKLVGAANITDLVKFPQGTGVVNTVGLIAVLKGPLSSEKGGRIYINGTIWNADNVTASPLVHMFDRDAELRVNHDTKTEQALQAWNATRQQRRR